MKRNLQGWSPNGKSKSLVTDKYLIWILQVLGHTSFTEPKGIFFSVSFVNSTWKLWIVVVLSINKVL